jgi:esterase
MAKMLSEKHTDLRLLLVDLRNHGDSWVRILSFGVILDLISQYIIVFKGFDGPHTIDACADDLIKLSHHLKTPFDIVCGHSFGGKVALQYAVLERHHPIEQMWILDTYPAPALVPNALSGSFQGSDVPKVLQVLSDIKIPIPSRDGLKKELEAQGLSRTVASWLTTNLRPEPQGGYDWKFDVESMKEMYSSYVELDSMATLANPPFTIQKHVRFVRAELEKRWSPELVGKLEAAAAQSKGRTKVSVLPNSGHWLHFDNPQGLLTMLSSFLDPNTTS